MSDKMTMEKFKVLDKKQKKEYIWDYYKFHITGIIIIITIIISMLNTLVFNPPPKTGMSIAFMGQTVNPTIFDAMKEDINALIIEDIENETTVITTYIIGGSNRNFQMEHAHQTKFMATIAAKDLDILIVNKEKFKELAYDGFFLDLNSVMSENMMNKYKDKVEISATKEDPTELVYGLNITKSEKIKGIIGGSDDKVIGIIVNSLRMDKNLKVIEWFME